MKETQNVQLDLHITNGDIDSLYASQLETLEWLETRTRTAIEAVLGKGKRDPKAFIMLGRMLCEVLAEQRAVQVFFEGERTEETGDDDAVRQRVSGAFSLSEESSRLIGA